MNPQEHRVPESGKYKMRIAKDKPIIIIENLHTHDNRPGGGTMAEKSLVKGLFSRQSIIIINGLKGSLVALSARLMYVVSYDMITLMAMMMYKGNRRVRSALSLLINDTWMPGGGFKGKAFVNAVNLLCKPHIQNQVSHLVLQRMLKRVKYSLTSYR